MNSETLFKQINSEHKDLIYRVCWGFCANAFDTEDLIQETMINIWKGLHSYRKESKLSTWVYRITINTCLLWKKKESKNTRSKNLTEIEVMENPDDHNEKEENIIKMKKAIQQLKEIDRSIILLVLEGCSYHEIAEVTGMSNSNVGVKINRIKNRLKTMMA